MLTRSRLMASAKRVCVKHARPDQASQRRYPFAGHMGQVYEARELRARLESTSIRLSKAILRSEYLDMRHRVLTPTLQA